MRKYLENKLNIWSNQVSYFTDLYGFIDLFFL